MIVKNNSYKSIVGFKGRQPLMTLNLTLKSIFKVILRLTNIFSMKTRIFDPGFGKSTKFCVKNIMYHVRA